MLFNILAISNIVDVVYWQVILIPNLKKYFIILIFFFTYSCLYRNIDTLNLVKLAVSQQSTDVLLYRKLKAIDQLMNNYIKLKIFFLSLIFCSNVSCFLGRINQLTESLGVTFGFNSEWNIEHKNNYELTRFWRKKISSWDCLYRSKLVGIRKQKSRDYQLMWKYFCILCYLVNLCWNSLKQINLQPVTSDMFKKTLISSRKFMWIFFLPRITYFLSCNIFNNNSYSKSLIY